ncbi:MAG: DUF192 domain-containing protein [Peptococcaceae bacterium]|nr:DUF192 domain-containing protein [Peptococcaceae bacterium]
MQNITKNAVLAHCVEPARSFIRRTIGLIGRRHFEPGDALWIKPCRGIHTFGMRFPIDIVYLDNNWKVMRTVASLKPWRQGPIAFSASQVIELPAGTLERTDTRIGDQLIL